MHNPDHNDIHDHISEKFCFDKKKWYLILFSGNALGEATVIEAKVLREETVEAKVLSYVFMIYKN